MFPDFSTKIDAPSFDIGASPVSKIDLKNACQQFERLFVPVLKQNGFVRSKGKWYRKYCNYQVQAICFLPYPSRSFCWDLRIICDYITLASQPWAISMMCNGALDLQQRLIHQVYPGCERSRASSELVYRNHGQSAERVMYVMPDYFSCYYARKKGDTVETCIDREYDLFLEQTIPLLNSFHSPQNYLDYVYREQDGDLLYTFTDNRFYYSALWCCDWASAEKSCNASILAANEDGKDTTEIQEDLQHILHHDSEWAKNFIMTRVKHTLETFKLK